MYMKTDCDLSWNFGIPWLDESPPPPPQKLNNKKVENVGVDTKFVFLSWPKTELWEIQFRNILTAAAFGDGQFIYHLKWCIINLVLCCKLSKYFSDMFS